ncbi:probable cytochrome P450 313a5 isoform X1 [Zingiber officinale]|uniref:probable cytochrome P450 313a5 isoform X1 n=1 Tax=Zingiber officinale TaxID=94328 RepID=UPI001C4CAFC3|nr:probable cytochrome P450 313a5 isoform X1 [Zingiber officinale]
MDLCDVALPYTLIGVLLWPPPRHPGAVACAGRFLRDYASRATNALLWIALISVTTVLFRRLARLVRLWVQGSRIPGPPSTPFLALIHGCGSLGNLSGYLSDLHEKYGPIVRLWLSPTQLLVSVRDTRLIKEMLIKADDKLPLTGRAFHLAFGKSSLFISSFHKVQKRRESLAEYMNRRLSARTNFITSKVVEFVIDRVDTIMAAGLLDCIQISRQLAFFVLGSTFFGDAFLDWPNASIYEELLMTIAKDGCFWASYSVPPFWSREYWKYQYMCNRLRHLTQDMIQYCVDKYDSLSQTDHRSYRENKDIAKEARLDASVLLDNMRSGGLFLEEMEKYFISEDEPCGNILGSMFHGCLAFASLISSILTRLVMHPDLQEKLYLEIVAVQEETSKLDLHDVEKMNLLMATIYESARLLPAGPLLQRCSLKHDICLSSGVTVPVGAILVVPLQLVQTDNSIWGKDASQFNPYRFLSEGKECIGICNEHEGPEKNSSLSELNENAAFLTFGYGTRACVGKKFAILGVSALIAALLQNYEVQIRFQPGLDDDPKPILNDCVLKLLPSPKISFTKRSQR